MKEILQNINERLHKPENKEKYDKLMLHTSEVDGGQHFLNTYNDADSIVKSANPSDFDYNIHVSTFNSLVKRLNQWLDDNQWA